jgi:hypothetical protein
MRWTSTGCEFSRPPATATVGDVTIPVTPPELDAAMADIDRIGRESYPDSYAGLEVDQEQVRAIVYRVPSDAFDEVLRLAGQSACIEVRDAAHPLRALTAWHDRVVADLNTLPSDGVHVVSVGARHDGAGVEVGVRDAAAAAGPMRSRYGPDAPLILVEQEPVIPIAAPAPERPA